MIGLVELKNWRAYEDAAVDLGSRVVFFCRSERCREVFVDGGGTGGVYLASQYLARQRPQSGSARGRQRSQWRSGSANRIRNCASNGRSHRLVGPLSLQLSTVAQFQEGKYAELLVDRWRADHGLIDRLMFTDPHLPAAKSAFPVRDHLAATLGVKPLLEVAAGLRAARKDITARVSVLRGQLRPS